MKGRCCLAFRGRRRSRRRGGCAPAGATDARWQGPPGGSRAGRSAPETATPARPGSVASSSNYRRRTGCPRCRGAWSRRWDRRWFRPADSRNPGTRDGISKGDVGKGGPFEESRVRPATLTTKPPCSMRDPARRCRAGSFASPDRRAGAPITPRCRRPRLRVHSRSPWLRPTVRLPITRRRRELLPRRSASRSNRSTSAVVNTSGRTHQSAPIAFATSLRRCEFARFPREHSSGSEGRDRCEG